MAPENKKALVFAILEFLRKSCKDGTIGEDDVEGIEVAMECIGGAFGVDPNDSKQRAAYSTEPASLLTIFDVFLKTKNKGKAQPSAASSSAPQPATPVTAEEPSEEDKKTAEELKVNGNKKMAERNYPEAIKLYTEAIKLNGRQAVYYSNRAAAYSQQGEHAKAVEDAKAAIAIDPKYSKAYSRMGHALFCQNNFKEAVEAYEKGLELDPNNATIKQSLETARSKLGSVDRSANSDAGAGLGGAGGMPDIGALLNNPALMSMAQQMMQSGALENMMNNPNIARMAQQMMGGGGAAGLAELMQNPEMMEMARQLMGNGNNGNNN